MDRRRRGAWVLAWTALVVVAAAALVRATSQLVQWAPGEVERSNAAVSQARWIVLLACLTLALAAAIAHRRLGRPLAAALTAGVAGAVLIATWMPIPFLAFITAGLGCWVLLGAFVAVLRTPRPETSRH